MITEGKSNLRIPAVSNRQTAQYNSGPQFTWIGLLLTADKLYCTRKGYYRLLLAAPLSVFSLRQFYITCCQPSNESYQRTPMLLQLISASKWKDIYAAAFHSLRC